MTATTVAAWNSDAVQARREIALSHADTARNTAVAAAVARLAARQTIARQAYDRDVAQAHTAYEARMERIYRIEFRNPTGVSA